MNNSDFVARQFYCWENTTILIPDVQGKEWEKKLLIKEFKEMHFIWIPERCPLIAQFVKHDMVEGSIPAGAEWRKAEGEKYLFPRD
jgi:hypothetical protein